MSLIRRSLKWVLLLAVVAAGVYWGRFSPQLVESLSLQRGTALAEVMGTGTLEARVSATISPKISGRIAEVLKDQGDEVTVETLLVRLDDEELLQQVAIADANVDAATASVVRLKSDKTRATAVFDQAKRHHTRVRALAEKSAVSAEDMDRATESLAVASSDIARAEAAIAEGEKGLIAAEKTRAYHQARLNDTRLTAPFDGMVVVRHRGAGDIAVPGSPVLTLISKKTLWIRAWVDETEMDRLAIGQPARIVFRSESEGSYSGKVARLGKQSDRETREFVVDVAVDELPANWAVGQRADVFVETARSANALLAPNRALVRDKGIEGVFVNDNGHARWQSLKLGLRGREATQVTEGLTGNEVVIVPRDLKTPLVAGRKVVSP